MGTKISAEKFYNNIETSESLIEKESQRFINFGGTYKFVKLSESETIDATELMAEFENTCNACENFKTYIDKVNSEIVDTAMPHYQDLSFDKKYIVNNSVNQIKEMSFISKHNGFIPNSKIAYFGRLFVAMKKTIEDDIEDEEILPCKQSIDNSLNKLGYFCNRLPMQHKESLGTVWVFSKRHIDIESKNNC